MELITQITRMSRDQVVDALKNNGCEYPTTSPFRNQSIKFTELKNKEHDENLTYSHFNKGYPQVDTIKTRIIPLLRIVIKMNLPGS